MITALGSSCCCSRRWLSDWRCWWILTRTKNNNTSDRITAEAQTTATTTIGLHLGFDSKCREFGDILLMAVAGELFAHLELDEKQN